MKTLRGEETWGDLRCDTGNVAVKTIYIMCTSGKSHIRLSSEMFVKTIRITNEWDVHTACDVYFANWLQNSF